MRIVEPSYEILFMMPGEEALALIERVGRIAYKSEDKIDDGYRPCPECNGKTYIDPCNDPNFHRACNTCVGAGKTRQHEPSSHKFVRMILKAERKAKMIRMVNEMFEEDQRESMYTTLAHDDLREALADKMVTKVIEYMEENPAHESVIEHSSATVMFTSNRGFTHELVRHRLAAFTQESTRYCDYNKGKFGKELTVIQPPAYTAEGAHVQGLAEWQEAVNDAQRHYHQLRKYGFAPQIARGITPHDLKADIAITANFREWRHVFKMRDSKNAHPDMRQLMRPLHEEFRQRIPIIFD